MTLADELGTTFLFEKLSRPQLDEVVALGHEYRSEAGEVLFVESTPADFFWVMLDGRIQLSRRVQASDVVLIDSDYRGAYFGAVRAFVKAAGESAYTNTARALQPGWFFRIPAEGFSQLLGEWFPMAIHLLDGLFLGLTNMETMVRQREKLIALGALSAGLAHELNNPAAASRRAASELRTTLDQLREGLLTLAGGGLSAEQLRTLAELSSQALLRSTSAEPVGGLAASDREDELGDWLEAHGVADGWRLAPPLVASGLDVDWVTDVERQLGPRCLGAGLEWVSNNLAASHLLGELESAGERISTLVGAVKEYSYLDQAPEQDVDVHQGLESTLVILGHKLSDGVTVERDYDRSLPTIEAYGSELNQVWTNLIDNAVAAMDGKGTLRLRTTRDGDGVLVEIGDSGSGIPPEVKPRIFDPFFTTKDVGKGTGLGLDAAYRVVVSRHHGSIDVESEPGDTRFLVHLPLRRAVSAGSSSE